MSNSRHGSTAAPWSDIDGRLVAEIIRERQRAGVTNATIKRDLGALSSVLNYAIVQGWIEANPVLPKLALVPERRDPIMLPTDRDIALVIERASGMVGDMVRAALVTGAREKMNSPRRNASTSIAPGKQLTLIGKRNKLRVIDLAPFDGHEFFAAAAGLCRQGPEDREIDGVAVAVLARSRRALFELRADLPETGQQDRGVGEGERS